MRPNGKRPSGRVISLKWDLAEVAHAVEAANILLDELSMDLRGDEPVVRSASRAAAAVISLVEARLDLLRRAVGGEVDARLLLAKHNVLDDVPEEDEPDLYIETDRRGEDDPVAGRGR